MPAAARILALRLPAASGPAGLGGYCDPNPGNLKTAKALGQMSAFGGKADIGQTSENVRL
jgi:hypothetical protein